jgi:hypothetical protein
MFIIGGVPLASSRFSVNSPDTIDLAAVMAAFEEINNVWVTLNGRVESVRGVPCLTFLGQAHDKGSEIGEVPPLASVKCHCGFTNHRTMESAIMWTLYQLDGEMARREMLAETKKP